MLLLPLSIVASFVLQAAQTNAETLPAPTSPHKPGCIGLRWQDNSRDGMETATRDDNRELMVHDFYPADPLTRSADDGDQSRSSESRRWQPHCVGVVYSNRSPVGFNPG